MGLGMRLVHLAALMMRRSPLLPGSMDPYLSDKPRAAAALIVAAARASGILMWRLTQARCITVGLRGGERGVGDGAREAERMGEEKTRGREERWKRIGVSKRKRCNRRGESN